MVPLKIREIDDPEHPFAVFQGKGEDAYDLGARFHTREEAAAWIPVYRRKVRSIIHNARRKALQDRKST